LREGDLRGRSLHELLRGGVLRTPLRVRFTRSRTLNLGIAGTTADWYFFGIGFYTPNFYFQEKSKFDAMKVFTSFIFVAKNKLGAQLLFPHEKISWGFAQPIYSWGK